jgi:peroxiredoxin
MKKIYLTVFLLLTTNFLIFGAQKMVDFSLYTTDDEKISSSEFKDKSLILFFWTTWCPFCRRAIYKLNEIYPELKNSDIQLLGINVGEPKEKVKNFLKSYNVEFKVLLDKEGEVASSYWVFGVPYYIFINKKGDIVFEDNYFPLDYKKIFKD